MLKILRKITDIIWSASIAGFILFFLFSISGGSCYVVLSGSMEPTVKTGSLIFVFPKETIREGDVITFWRNGARITHRVAAETKEGYLTRGDANEQNDSGFVKPSQIVGTVVFSVAYLGYVLSFLKGFCLYGVILILWLSFLFFKPNISKKGKHGKSV